jgi:hypothetical protein
MRVRFAMTARRGFSIVAALVVVAACSATPGSTGPVATENSSSIGPTFTLEPEPTDESVPTDETPRPPNDIGNGRPSTVTVTIAGNTTGANGTHTATGTTRVCGNALLNLTGNPNGFNYEFPFEGEHDPEDVSFSAENLLPGTTTSTFYLSLGIVTNQITPSIIADPGGTAGDAGTATRTEAGGTTTLVIHATNNRSETIDLTATCGPRAP